MSLASSGLPRLFTVVIASLCDDARRDLLKRACNSVRAMADGLDYSIIVVANGSRVSASVLEWLAVRPDVEVIRLRSGSHPLARRVGAEMANCEFLGFLDDDDELMPGMLERKLAYFRDHPEVDVLVTDGWRVSSSGTTNIFPPVRERSADLVQTMMQTGWGACALTLRSQNVALSAFDAEFRHMEWTLTVLLLARRYRFGFLDEPTYRYYETTPDSLSKESAHMFAAPEVWRRLAKEFTGTSYEDYVRRRYGKACHAVSNAFALQGDMWQALRFHAESLLSKGGLVYLSFSVRLLLFALRRPFR